jgi:hypothetical protein
MVDKRSRSTARNKRMGKLHRTAKLIEKDENRELYLAPGPPLDDYVAAQPALHM